MTEKYLHNLLKFICIERKLLFKISFLILCFSLTGEVFALNPANPNANQNVRLILDYFASLKSRSDHRLISGQFMGYSRGVGGYPKIEQIHTNTGKYVGIVGSDYSTQPNDHSIIEYEHTNPGLIKAWKAGSLVSLTLHLPNPTQGGLKQMIDLNKVLNRAIEPATYDRWIKEMDIVAAGLSQLQDSGVVVLFRPFHEMNGGWFWWGGSDTAVFKELWKQMFNYFTYTKKLNNLLWVFAPNRQNTANTTTPAPASFYPGDEYVDITGLDAYTSNISMGEIVGIPAMVKLGKPFGLTEYGPGSSANPSSPDYDYRLFVNSLKYDIPDVCFFMCWNANWGLDVNKFVTEALSDPYIANRNNLTWKPLTNISTNFSSVEAIQICSNPLKQGNSLTLKLNGLMEGHEALVSVFDTLGRTVIRERINISSDGKYKIRKTNSLKQGHYLLSVLSSSKAYKAHFLVK